MVKYFINNNNMIMAIKIIILLTTLTSYTCHNHSVPLLGKHPAIPLSRQLINFPLHTTQTVITSTVFYFQFPTDRNFPCKWK